MPSQNKHDSVMIPVKEDDGTFAQNQEECVAKFSWNGGLVMQNWFAECYQFSTERKGNSKVRQGHEDRQNSTGNWRTAWNILIDENDCMGLSINFVLQKSLFSGWSLWLKVWKWHKLDFSTYVLVIYSKIFKDVVFSWERSLCENMILGQFNIIFSRYITIVCSINSQIPVSFTSNYNFYRLAK